MALVVFMRAVNVGGYQKCRPAELAKGMADLGVVNVGAAGTFVVKRRVSEAALRKRMREGLGFEGEMMVCSEEEVMGLVKSKPFGAKLGKDVKGFVSVMERPLRKRPELPVDQPAGTWGVRVIEVRGRFAMSLYRRLGKGMVYPNAVVEKKFEMAATTRGWDTVVRVGELLRAERGDGGIKHEVTKARRPTKAYGVRAMEIVCMRRLIKAGLFCR
jgi:uncharacterized protein (DUF1697 family)